MNWYHHIGKQHESRALAYLENRGYTLIRRNWKCCGSEIDIIASKDNQLHFIEVSTHSDNDPGFPVQAVKRRKFQSLVHASRQYLIRHNLWQRALFTILAINLRGDGIQCSLVEDVKV